MDIQKVRTETSLGLKEISKSLEKLSQDIKKTATLKNSCHRNPLSVLDVNAASQLSRELNDESTIDLDKSSTELDKRSSVTLDKSSSLKKSKVSFSDSQSLPDSDRAKESDLTSTSSILRSTKPTYSNQNTSIAQSNRSLYSNMSSRNSLNQYPSYSRSRNLSTSRSNFQSKWLPEFWKSQTSVRPNRESGVKQEEFDAMRFFPTTLGKSSYSMTIPVESLERPQLSSRYSSRRSMNRSYSAYSSNSNKYDSSRYSDNFESLHSILQRTPTLLAASIPQLSPFEEHLTKLKLERLQIEEEKLREIRRRVELENLRGPEPKWYEKKDSSFSYENKKNTQLVRSQDKWNDLLRRREQILSESRMMDTLYATTVF